MPALKKCLPPPRFHPPPPPPVSQKRHGAPAEGGGTGSLPLSAQGRRIGFPHLRISTRWRDRFPTLVRSPRWRRGVPTRAHVSTGWGDCVPTPVQTSTGRCTCRTGRTTGRVPSGRRFPVSALLSLLPSLGGRTPRCESLWTWCAGGWGTPRSSGGVGGWWTRCPLVTCSAPSERHVGTHGAPGHSRCTVRAPCKRTWGTCALAAHPQSAMQALTGHLVTYGAPSGRHAGAHGAPGHVRCILRAPSRCSGGCGVGGGEGGGAQTPPPRACSF